jgi:hypothetical protein
VISTLPEAEQRTSNVKAFRKGIPNAAAERVDLVILGMAS